MTSVNCTFLHILDHFVILTCALSLCFSSLWETTQTLFWAIFGLVDLDNFELTGIKEFTRFWGLVMFGSFSVINIIVLLNLLIAMMNHSYQLISVSSVRLKDLFFLLLFFFVHVLYFQSTIILVIPLESYK